jgi:hypothetical protein
MLTTNAIRYVVTEPNTSPSPSHIRIDARSVSQSVSLGVESLVGPMTTFYSAFSPYGFCRHEPSALTRGRLNKLQVDAVVSAVHLQYNPCSIYNLHYVQVLTAPTLSLLPRFLLCWEHCISWFRVKASCCLHNFVTKSYKYGMLKGTGSSRVGVRLSEVYMVRRTTVFCRRRHFEG